MKSTKYRMLPNGMCQLRTRDNKLVRTMLENDYEAGVTKINNVSCYNKKPLMSVSRVFKGLSEYQLAKVPDYILDPLAQQGKNLTINLKNFIESKKKDIDLLDFENLKDRDLLENLLQWMITHELKVLAVEKCIRTENWIAYLDAIIKTGQRKFIMEIKLRSNNQVRKSDLLQAQTYEYMTNIPVMILILNRNTYEITYHWVKKIRKNLSMDLNHLRMNESLEYLGFPKMEKVLLEIPKIEKKQEEIDWDKLLEEKD